MGDKRRGKVFTEYLNRNFNLNNVLLVADGNLVTGKQLYKYCNQLTVVDPFIRASKNDKKKMKVVGKYFFANSSLKCDLIVGMHPDEATGEIVQYAINNNVPCVIVPCCKLGLYSNLANSNGIRWINCLKNILIQNRFDVYVDQLKIKGANIVIRAVPF